MKRSYEGLSKGMVLITIILMDILAGAEVDLFVPSFPELQNYFGLSPFWVEALLSINFIGLCLSLFFVGDLADRYGRKPIILLGLIIFIMGSFLCLWATSYFFLFMGRFLQGIGVAAPATLCFLIIADFSPLEKQQSLMALLNGLVNVSVAAAPVIGSYVTLYFHWQGNFILLLSLGLATFIMTLFFIPQYKPIEYKGASLLKGYFSILSSKPLLLFIITISLMFVPYWIFIGMSPILYMENLGVSLAQFGYYQGTLALVFAVGSIFFSLIINKYDQKKMLFISGYLFITGFICILGVSFLNAPHPLLITLAFLPFIIGQIIPSAILYPLCLNFMPEAKGRISSLIQGGRLVLAAFSLELAGYCYQGSFQHIGIIIAGFIFVSALTLFLIIKKDFYGSCF